MRTVNANGFNQDDYSYFSNFKLSSFAGHKKLPTAISWSPSGDKLVVAETSVKIWNFDYNNGCQKLSQSKLHQNNVDVVKFGTANIFGTLSKQSLRFWDIRQSPLKSSKTQKKNKSDFVSFCWNQSGKKLQNSSQQQLKYCILTKDNNLNLMDFRNQGKPISTLNFKNINTMELCQIGWDPSNSFFLCAGGQGSAGGIVLLDAQTFQEIPQGFIQCHCARINDFAFSPDNQKIALVSDDSLVQIHEFPQFICQRSYSNKSDSSTLKASFSYNGKYLSVGSQGNTFDIFNIKYGGQAFKIQTQTSAVISQWHPKRQILCYIDEKRKTSKNEKAQDYTYIHIFQYSY